MTKSFQQLYTLQQRQEIFSLKKEKYPTKVFIILESLKLTNSLSSRIYVVDRMQLLLQFKSQIFKNDIQTQSTLLFIENQLPQADSLMGELYDQYKSKEDGFLYIQFRDLNTFG